jgi:WD40 repeat protein
LIFSRDNKHLYIGNDDGTINILNTSSPESDDQPMELEHTLSAPASQWENHLLSLTGHSFIVWIAKNRENPGKYCLLTMGKDQVCQSLPDAANSEFKTWAFNSQENLFHVTQQMKSLSIIPTPPLKLINSDGYNTKLSKSPPAELDLECPNFYTISAAISPTEEIATGGVQSLCLWNSKGGLIKQVSFSGEGAINQIVYSGNGKVLAVVDRALGVSTTYDSSGAQQAQFPLLDQSSRVALNNDGSRIAISGNNTVKILGPVGQELALFRLPNAVLAMSFPSDGLRIAIRSPKPTKDSRNVHFHILKQPTVRSLTSHLCKRNQDYLEYKKMAGLCKR